MGDFALILLFIALPFMVVKVKEDLNFYRDMAHKSQEQTKKALKGWESCIELSKGKRILNTKED